MYRGNSVEHTPGQICTYRVRRVDMWGNCGRRETLFCAFVFVLPTCEFPLTEPPPEASSSVAREYIRP